MPDKGEVRKDLILTKEWLATHSDQDVLWVMARAEDRGWTLLVK